MTDPALSDAAPYPAAPPARPPGRAPGPLRWMRSVLGLRRSFTVGGVKYTEQSPEPLARALSRRGSGSKEFLVLFPGGRRMHITATPGRTYEDLNGAALLDEYRLVGSSISPGMRVVALRSGTGYAGAWLARAVGPSGSVVALDPDTESIRYARWRYRLPNVAFEVGDHSALAGEVDGAFDAALAVRALRQNEDAAPAIAELWRVLAPGGLLVATAPALPPDPPDQTRSMTSEALATLLREPARRDSAAHRAAGKSRDNGPEDRPPDSPASSPPMPETELLRAPPTIAAAMIRKPRPA